MGPKVLGHRESLDLVLSEDLGHLLVWGEVLLVFRVLEVMLLEVGPEELRQLGARRLLLANDGGKLGAQLLDGGEAFSSAGISFSFLGHGVVQVRTSESNSDYVLRRQQFLDCLLLCYLPSILYQISSSAQLSSGERRQFVNHYEEKVNNVAQYRSLMSRDFQQRLTKTLIY